MEWARDSIDIVVLSLKTLMGMRIEGCRLAYTLTFHDLYDISELFTNLSILIELRLEMLEDSRAEHTLRYGFC